eukprot:scaffold225857_cov34-Prasinocladus_malaysianus.AAC.1
MPQRRDGQLSSSSDYESGGRYDHLPGRAPSHHNEKPHSRKWCLAFAVVGLMCAISLIAVSEGWLEAMGLAGGM